jgi:hypothetical protein
VRAHLTEVVQPDRSRSESSSLLRSASPWRAGRQQRRVVVVVVVVVVVGFLGRVRVGCAVVHARDGSLHVPARLLERLEAVGAVRVAVRHCCKRLERVALRGVQGTEQRFLVRQRHRGCVLTPVRSSPYASCGVSKAKRWSVISPAASSENIETASRVRGIRYNYGMSTTAPIGC